MSKGSRYGRHCFFIVAGPFPIPSAMILFRRWKILQVSSHLGVHSLGKLCPVFMYRCIFGYVTYNGGSSRQRRLLGQSGRSIIQRLNYPRFPAFPLADVDKGLSV